MRNVHPRRNLGVAARWVIPCVAAFALLACASGVSRTDLAADYYDIANAYYTAGNQDKAAEYYARAIALNPNLAQANYNLARIYITTGKYESAIQVLDSLLAKDPQNLLLHDTRAYARAKSGKLAAALDEFRKVLDSNPYDKTALFNGAEIEHSLGNFQKAYDLMKRASAVLPADTQILLRLGMFASDAGDSASAIADLENYTAQKPDDSEALTTLAELYTNAQYYDRAIQTYDALLKKKSTPALLFAKARILLTDIQDGKTGLSTLEQALKAGYADQESLRTLLNNSDLVSRDSVRALVEPFISGKNEPSP